MSAPSTGEYNGYLQLISAEVTPGVVGGRHFDEVATYRVHFDVVAEAGTGKTERDASAQLLPETGWRFCGYRVEKDSVTRNSSWTIRVNPNGWWAGFTAYPTSGRGWSEGDIVFRYVKTAEPVDGASDGFSMGDITHHA